jgi:hypothetical protein
MSSFDLPKYRREKRPPFSFHENHSTARIRDEVQSKLLEWQSVAARYHDSIPDPSAVASGSEFELDHLVRASPSVGQLRSC